MKAKIRTFSKWLHHDALERDGATYWYFAIVLLDNANKIKREVTCLDSFDSKKLAIQAAQEITDVIKNSKKDLGVPLEEE